jgi:hypothetical protein
MEERRANAATAVAMVIAVMFCGAGSVSALYGPSSDVVQLTSSNFKNKVRVVVLETSSAVS